MITIDNKTDYLVDTKILEVIAKALTNRDIELIICDDDEIRILNREHRGVDRATDVLSFPLELNFEALPLGSIVISIDYVRAGAKRYGHTPKEELALLFIHGILHLLGFDHEIDQGQMREKEHTLIKEFKLPDSLIVRTKGED